MTTPRKARIGFIGLGIMGQSMAGNLLGRRPPAAGLQPLARQGGGAGRAGRRAGATRPATRPRAPTSSSPWSAIRAMWRRSMFGPDGVLAHAARRAADRHDHVEPGTGAAHRAQAAAHGCRLRSTRRCRAATWARATPSCRSWSAASRRVRARRCRSSRRWARTSFTWARRRRPAHQDGQPDRHRLHHHGRVRGPRIRAKGGPGPAQVVSTRSAPVLPAASSSTSSGPRWSRAISRPAS